MIAGTHIRPHICPHIRLQKRLLSRPWFRAWFRPHALLALTLGAACSAATLAQPAVWRCGPDGRTFQASPCEGGQAITTPPPPSAQAQAEARAVRERELQGLAKLAAERREREREAKERGLAPAGIVASPVGDGTAVPRSTDVKSSKARSRSSNP